jgi:hypothetical protein
MEDALISPEGFMILSGAGLIEASGSKPVYQHVTETIDGNVVTVESDGTQDVTVYIPLSNQPYLPSDKNGNYAYVMFMKDGDIISEPYIPEHGKELTVDEDGNYVIKVNYHDCYDASEEEGNSKYIISGDGNVPDITTEFDSVLVDYYVERQSDAQQIEITADKFGGNYYLEASTLFRDQNGVDLPAEFIIPNCKIQSNFTFTMASSGDPSTFTFTMDAFPDYTRFDHSKKVLAAIQIIKDGRSQDLHRHSTSHEADHEALL